MNELLEKAKSGDVEAFGELMKIIEKDLEKIAASKLTDKSYIDDAIQNVYYRAYIKLSTLKDNSKFRSWIFTILKNECSNINKSLARNREVSLEKFDNILEDSLNSNSESDINFEQMISKLSEDEKKLLRMKFKENFSNMEIAEEIGIPYNTVKSKINRAIKKITLVVLLLMLFSGFTVLATFVIKQIKAHFTMSTNAINTAVENNYVQEIDSDFVYSNGIGIKVDAIVLDDKNLDISFVYDVLDKEKYGEITGIRLNDYVIKSGDILLFNSKRTSENLIKMFKQNSKVSEKLEDRLNNSILFSTFENLPRVDTISIEINSVTINSNKTKNFYDIKGFWNTEHEVIEKLNERSVTKYLMEDNKFAENATIDLSDTDIRFEIKFIESIDYNEILAMYLYNENDKFDWINNKFTYETNILKVSFDISKYTKNIDKLTLKISRKNKEDIVIKFRRDF